MNICLVGYKGYWAAFLRRNIENIKGMNITALVDKEDGTSLSSVSKDDFDTVIVATPPETHYAITKEAILLKKNVLVEKPFTTNNKHAKELLILAKENNVKLGIDHTFLFSSHIRVMKEIIKSGKIGRPLHILSTRQNLGKFQDSGVVWDLMPHDIAMTNYLMDSTPKITNVALFSHIVPNVHDVAEISMRYKDVTCQMSLSWLHPKKVRTTSIIGTEGMIEYDMLSDLPLSIYDKKANKTDQRWEHSFNWVSYYKGDSKEPLHTMLEEFKNYCMYDGNFVATGEDGLKVVECIEETLELGQK